MPTSKREPARPFNSILPSVGSVILDKIFNNVVFPAPFLPIIPITSPRLTLKETSFKAQIYSARDDGP